MRCRVRASWALVLALVLGFASRLPGQGVELAARGPRFLAVVPGSTTPVDASNAAILQRRVSLDLAQVTVAAALKEIGRQANLAFLYSRSLLPAERTVSLEVKNLTLAAALTEVLLGTGLDVLVSPDGQLALIRKPLERKAPVQSGAVTGRVTDVKTQTALAGATVVVQGTSHSATTGNDGRYRIAGVAPGTYTVRARYIGYAPGLASVTVNADQEATADFTLEKSAQRLDEVVTTGTVVPTEVKALPTPISVITADDIQRQNLQRVDQVFRGMVPGATAWDEGPRDYFTTINVRGTSTLIDNPGIKTFIDGVEVADPQYITTIDPNSIDRIEITRGPQASTLYGAGALNGVMQLFTKKGQLGLTRPEVVGKVSAGGVGGFDGRSSALQTDNALSIMGGGATTSYSIGGSYRHTGEWVPSYTSTNWGLSAGAQTTQGPLTLSTSARYADKTLDEPWDTRFQAYTYWSRPFYQTDRVRQQTYGATASLEATHNWRHTLTLAYDQTYLSTYSTQPRFTTPADSFLSLFAQHQAKTSLLYHTDVSVRLGRAAAAVVTAGINYDAYDGVSSSTSDATRTTGSVDGTVSEQRTPWTTTGYFGQVQISVAEQLFLTSGLRAERNANFGTDFGTAWSPRVGAAYVLSFGPATVKLRASYGESIRAPDPGLRDAVVSPLSIQLANPALAPERQRGVDGGLDLNVGRASLGVTYYNQRAINLIDLITVPTPPDTPPTYQFQNLDRVKNEGWEFEAHLPVGPVQVAGTYSITHSTVQQLPPDFAGDYQVGDQILMTPRASAGASVSYSLLPHTTLTGSMTHIGHYTGLDFAALYGVFYGDQPFRGSFRAYWMEYPTVTKFAVGVSQVLSKGLTAFVRAENVGNNLRSEQTNTSISTPRSVVVGANLRY